MKYATQPINLEASIGPQGALKLLVPIDGADPAIAASNYAIWAARTPDVLTPLNLVSLAKGRISIVDLGNLRQDGVWSGLRQASNLSLSGSTSSPTGSIGLEASLFTPGVDMPLRGPASASNDTQFSATQEYPDGPWLIAITCLMPDGTVDIARGGLGQMAGYEHLAAVWMSPSNFSATYEIGEWLTTVISGMVPMLNWAVSQTPGIGESSIKGVFYTSEAQKDIWPVIYIMPQRETERHEGVSAPDRHKCAQAYTIRIVGFGDDPVVRIRGLTALAGAIKELLNTRTYRAATMPSGAKINMSYASDIEWGQTEDGFDDAVDITWSTEMIRIGLF